jgi:hypothetical protein
MLIAVFILGLCMLFAAASASASVSLTDPIDDIILNEDEGISNILNLHDHFADGQSVLSFSAVSEHNKVDIKIKEDGTVDLTPPSDWFGYEEVTFIASDGDQKVSDTILVIVEPVNDRPQQIAPLLDSISFLEDTFAIDAFNLHNHFTDIDSKLEFSYSRENVLVKINDNGYVSFYAPLNWFGSEEVVIIASDGEIDISDTILVTVSSQNDKPECTVNIQAISLKGSSRTQTLNLGNYFSDVEDESLTYGVNGNRHVEYRVDPQNGELRISAPDTWSGKEVIMVTALDSNGASRSMQVVVVASPSYDSQGQIFYLTGLVLGLAVVGSKLQFTGRPRIVRSPVKLESYRHYKKQ